MTAVDIHAHAMPLPLLRWLESRDLADLSAVDAGVVRLDPSVSGVGPGAPLPLARSMYDASRRLVEMDQTGVSHEAVSLPPFLMASSHPDAGFVTELADRGNDALVEYCSASERLIPLAGLPLGFPAATEVATRWLSHGDIGGVAIGTRGAGADLDAAVNADLWALLSRRGTFVFLHPSGVPEPARLTDFWFPQLLGYPIETAISVARLAFSGVLEATPLRLCLAHGGGCLPALRGRLDLGWQRKDVAHTTNIPPNELFDQLYYDTAVFDPTALRRLVEDVGAEHVLLGTDHPFDLAERDPVGFVRSAGLGPVAEEQVLVGNAATLLGLTV